MEVNSKFNKGDTIYFMNGELPQKAKITGITFFTGEAKRLDGSSKVTAPSHTQVTYHVDNCIEVHEQNAFPSKDKMIKALFDNLDKEYSPFDAAVKEPKHLYLEKN